MQSPSPLQEVQRLLVASKPVRVRTEQTPEMSDHDFAAEQKAQLLLTAQRTLATSVGRGMFTLNTIRPIITQAIRVPPVRACPCLWCLVDSAFQHLESTVKWSV